MAGRSMYQLTNVDKAGCLTQEQWVREQTGKLIVPAIFLRERWRTGAPYVTAYRVWGEGIVNGVARLADGSSAESFRSRLGFVLATESQASSARAHRKHAPPRSDGLSDGHRPWIQGGMG